MTPIYDELCSAAQLSATPPGNDAVARLTGLRLVPPTSTPAPAAPATAAPIDPATFPARVLRIPRTPPWRADQLP